MTRFRKTALAVCAVAGATLALAAPAHASVNAVTVYTSNEAGWQAQGNGWNFRYLQTDVTLPDITTTTFKHAFGSYGVSLRFKNGSQITDLGLSSVPTDDASPSYGGNFAIEYADHHQNCINNGTNIPAGHTVRMTLFYDYIGGQIHWGVTDRTNPALSFSGSCSDPGQFFGAGQMVAGFSGDDWAAATGVHAVSGNQPLVRFNNTVVTSRTGIRSSIGTGSGHWPTQKLAMTDDATPSGTLLASVPFAWGKFAVSPDNTVRDGRNFTVWMPSAS